MPRCNKGTRRNKKSGLCENRAKKNETNKTNVHTNTIKMSKRLQSLQETYASYKQRYLSDNDTTIIDMLEDVARKKYYKDPACAEYQEYMFNDFISNAKTNDRHIEALKQLRNNFEGGKHVREVKRLLEQKIADAEAKVQAQSKARKAELKKIKKNLYWTSLAEGNSQEEERLMEQYNIQLTQMARNYQHEELDVQLIYLTHMLSQLILHSEETNKISGVTMYSVDDPICKIIIDNFAK